MIERSQITDVQNLWSKAKRFLILTHVKPDGDAVSSLLAMRQIIASGTSNKISITLVSRDQVPTVFSFLSGADSIQNDFFSADFDLIITVDCGDLRRTGFGDRVEKMVRTGKLLINIDHHPKNNLHRLATYNLVDQDAASTTQILYQISQVLNVPIDSVLATYLFTGLYTDTGSFQHPVTSSEALKIASIIMAKGARIQELRRNLSVSRTVAMLRLWGTVLERLKISKQGLVISAITREDIFKNNANEDDSAGVLSMLESANSCRVALLLSEQVDGTIKGSLRSNKSGVDVNRLARFLGGGGHSRAAGFVINGTLKLDSDGWNIV